MESLTNAVESLKTIPVESTGLIGISIRLQHLIRHIHAIYQSECASQQQGSTTNTQHLNQFQDLVSNISSNLARLSTKGELVEVIFRRSKAYEVLEQLEKRIIASISNNTYIEVIQGHCNKKPLYVQYLEHIDLLLSIDCLLYMKYLMEQSSSLQQDDLLEHMRSIQILLNHVNQQRLTTMIKPLNSLDYWSIEENYAIAMRELLHLFPERLLIGYDEHYKNDDSGLNLSYARSYRGLWSGKLVHIKKVARKNVFYRDELGLMEAIHCMHTNSKVIQDSPFLHQLLGVSWDQEQNFVYFISPLAAFRSLFDVFSNPFLKSEEKIAISPLEKISIILDISQGIQHLHSHGIYHGRLKDTNILLYDGYRAKICDFGVDMFLSQETRVLCPGTHGLRFTPPEVVQQLQKIQEWLQAGTNNAGSTGSGKTANNIPGNDIFKAINATGKLTFESALGIYGPYLPSFSTDIYAIGAVALVLLSEKQLFPNVGSESGVKAQLLSGQIPIVPYSYPDQELLKSFQEQVVNTTVTLFSHIRPAASALVKIVEKEYVDLASKISMVEVTKREEQMKQVEQEIAELDVKVAQHEMLVSKGKELIGKKEQEKSKIFDGKQKREHEASIEKARIKLIAFQDELEGLKEDKFGAEQDLDQLKELLHGAQKIVKRVKKHALEDRVPMSPLNSTSQEDLYDIYCTSRDAERFQQQIQNDLKLKGGPQRSKSISAAPTSPFVGICQAIESLTPAQRSNIDKTLSESTAMEKTLATVNNRIIGLSGGVYCRLYKALVDHHELVFRVPIQPTSTPSATSGTAIAGAVRSPSLNAVTASASVNLAFQKYQPSSATPTVSGGTGYRMPTIPDSDDDDDEDGNYNRPIRYIKETDLVDSDDDDPEVLAGGESHAHQHAHANHHQHGDSPSRYHGEDASSQQRDYNQRLMSRATNATGISRYTQANLTQILQEVEKWVIPIAGSLTDEDDDFPSSEYDILHVQYLAAARGSWEEAVGMRRHNLGFTDEHVSILLEQQYTPIHLAAYLGNLRIVRQLVEDVGLPPHICDGNNESPLHLACKRGHLSMIRYLVEECGLDALQENSQGVTPIQFALKGGYLEVVVYFIEETPAQQKIPLDFQDSVLKGSLLHWACLGKRVELVEYLIVTQNIPVETIAESDKSTCLLWAALGSTVDVVKFLIENASADPNVSNAQGWTCLHMATSSGDVDKTIYLIENARLKITEKNANHKTPFEVANGAAAIYLQERKKKGFVSGSIVDKAKKRKSSVKS